MTCLVTGGAGFIGSHLCDRLVALGHDVVAIDNLLTGKKNNISQLLSNTHFRFIHDDLLNIGKYKIRVDLFFHFASAASPRWYQKYPIETLLVNTYGTYLLLELAKKDKAIFIFASTSEVYGDPKEHPQVETYWGHVNPNGPRSCYDEAKRCGEAYVASFVRQHELDGRIIRIFNTYGPRMDVDDGRVVSNFVYQALKVKPLTIHGDGKQTRSFCFVSDMIEAICAMAFKKGLKGEVVNVGNPEEVTILDLAKRIELITGKKLQLSYTLLPQDDPSRRRPTIEKAKKLLSWEPKVVLNDGLKRTIDYFSKEYV